MDSSKCGIAIPQCGKKRLLTEKALLCKPLYPSHSKVHHQYASSVMEELEKAEKQLHQAFLNEEKGGKRCKMQRHEISSQMSEALIPLGSDAIVMHKSEMRRPETDFIPGLVNRIILESTGQQKLYMRTFRMTQVLLSLILRFGRPFLERQALQSETFHLNSKPIRKEKKGDDKVDGEKNTELNDYQKRAAVWTVDRIRDLLQPNVETRIPALDALLVASGRFESLSHEIGLQESMRLNLDKCSLASYSYVRDTKRHCLGENENTKKRSESQLYPDFCLKEHMHPTSNSHQNDQVLSKCKIFDQMKSFLNRHDDDMLLEDKIIVRRN